MNINKGLIFGVLAGLVGAMVWAGIACFTGYEIGWIAWGIGAFVGFAFAFGSGGRGVQAGTIAVVITVLSIVAGKYTAVDLMISQELGTEEEVIQNAVAQLDDDKVMVSYVAEDVIAEKVARNEFVSYPENVDPDNEDPEAYYSPEIWSEAKASWEGMTPEDKQEYRRRAEEFIVQNVKMVFAESSKAGFLYSFTPMDILFFGLAVLTAYRIASRGRAVAPEPALPEEQEPVDKVREEV